MGEVIVFLVVSWHPSCLFSSCEKTFDCHLWSCSTHYGWCHSVSGRHHHGDGWQVVYLKELISGLARTGDTRPQHITPFFLSTPFFSFHYFIPKIIPYYFCNYRIAGEKTFTNSHKTVKFMKVFSLKSFPLYDILFVLKLSHTRIQLILHIVSKYWSPHLSYWTISVAAINTYHKSRNSCVYLIRAYLCEMSQCARIKSHEIFPLHN